MNVQWEYPLPTDHRSCDYQYESPIHVRGDALYFITSLPQTLHVVNNRTGAALAQLPCPGETVIPSKCFFTDYGDKLLVYTGELWVYHGEKLTKLIEWHEHVEVNSWFVHENFFVCATRGYLYCCDLDTCKQLWSLEIFNAKGYIGGNISFFEGKIACSGKNQLLFVDIESGQIVDQIKISRIDKLFGPIRTADGNLLIGYTNWSVAGVLKYDLVQQKVLWRYKRNFEGPLLRCKLHTYENFVYWVKNDTELICVNAEDGSEVFRFRTEPWLYTDLHFRDGNILFGTSGADGYLYSIDAQSGGMNWSIPMKNGCVFFDFVGDTICTGDWSGEVWQIACKDASVVQTLQTCSPVIGAFKAEDNQFYTVIWATDEAPVRLIGVQL